MIGELRRWAQPALLVGVIMLAVVVRTVGLSDNPPGFFTDEASFGYNAYTILKTGGDEHGESWPVLFKAFGEYKLPVFIYSLVPFVAGLGLSEVAVRLGAATYGTLTVFTTYLLASALFRQRSVGLAAALFLAIMPWHIHYSRTGLGDLVSFLPFLTLGLYLFLVGVRRNKLWPLAGVVLGLTLYTYRAAWVVLPPLFILLALLYYRELLKGWRMALPALAIVLLFSIPIFLYFLSGSGGRSQQVWILNLNLGAWDTVKTFATQYASHFSISFLFQQGDDGSVLRHYLPGYGHLYYVQLPLVVLGTLGILLKPRREKTLVLGLLALYPLAGAVSDVSPISSRTILGSVVFALLTGYGLMLLVNGFRRLNRPYGQAAAGVALVVVGILSLASFTSYLRLYHSEYPKLSAGYWGWQSGPKEIIEYFLSVEGDYDQLVMDGEFNAPHEFFRFYAPEGCGKCIIGNTASYDPRLKQLFALRPKNLVSKYTYRTLHTLTYPNGEHAFYLVDITGLRESSSAPSTAHSPTALTRRWGDSGL
jgi:4-amino-4-deoxy-L-arabinose transferase-like glycosyltransferase